MPKFTAHIDSKYEFLFHELPLQTLKLAREKTYGSYGREEIMRQSRNLFTPLKDYLNFLKAQSSYKEKTSPDFLIGNYIITLVILTLDKIIANYD